MNKIVKYDKQGRIILEKITHPGITYKYKYELNSRIVNIRLDSDHKLNRTIIHQEKVDDVFKNVLKKEFTDKFIITTKYDINGKVLKITRKRRGSNKKYIRENIAFKENEPIIWVEETKKTKNLGFKIEFKEIF